MTKESKSIWPYPGSRWWKFDFHTHTLASRDTKDWQKAAGTKDEVTPKKWLLKYMEADVDCIAVTDHNSGEWIDKLKNTYNQMLQQEEEGTPPDGFRKLTLFPGVEISVQGGFHLLAVFDPSEGRDKIDRLLGAVDYKGTQGHSDGATTRSPADVVQAVLDAGGIPIPAHSDQSKGLLRVNPGTRECALDSQTVRQVMDIEGLLAVEWVNDEYPVPTCVDKQMNRVARVLGSDSHSFRGSHPPGSRYTWIKMADRTLEGLRLALLDGNGTSVRRSVEGAFEPFETPTHFVTRIKIKAARFMGNGESESLNFTPFYNALIGGRGTGKSTIVHAMRLAYRRDEELRRLGEKTEPCRQFTSFTEPVRSRDGGGALRDDTEIRIELMRDGVKQQLCWRQDSQGEVVEEQDEDGQWRPSASQAVTPERFPIRLFSQGQIAAMAGESRQALFDVIDEAAEVGDLYRGFEEAKRTYFSQRARLRELDGHLEGRPELERKLSDLNRKLGTLAQSRHAEVLKAHQGALRQCREVDTTLQQLQEILGRIESLAQDLLLDDWPAGVFDLEKDQDAVSWRDEAERLMREARGVLTKAARALAGKVQTLGADTRLTQWRQRAGEFRTQYETLQATLETQGVHDPRAFERLEQERRQIKDLLKKLDQFQEERKTLETENQAEWNRVLGARKAITQARKKFVQEALEANDFVRMKVIGFGFEARSIERGLRELLDCQDDRFESDILRVNGEGPADGLAFELAQAEDREANLNEVKRRLIGLDEGLGGHFRNHLQRKLKKPEFADHIRCWFPDDDLQIKYSRKGDGYNWSDIDQSSQGQRSAALLAFLLAFGGEPLILDQPEDDLDNHLIYELIVRQISGNKLRRQLIIVTHNSNVVVNGDAEMVYAFDFHKGQCRVVKEKSGALQQNEVQEEVCQVMEGGREAFSQRWARLGREV